MRDEADVLAAIDTLERINDAVSRQITREVRRFDELSGVYNHNSQLLSALQWVTGADTLRFTSTPGAEAAIPDFEKPNE